MQTLILLRHAKAVREHEAPSDRARALAPRGRRDAAAAGEALVAAGLEPDVALISAAVRTRETAELALAVFPGLETRIDERLYLCEAERIWGLALASGKECVLIVGHNPGVHALSAYLAAASHDRSKAAREMIADFPTCAFAAFRIGGETLAAPGPQLIASWRPERG